MKITNEMIQLAEHTYRNGLGYSKRWSNEKSMKAALEAVFSLIEKEKDPTECAVSLKHLKFGDNLNIVGWGVLKVIEKFGSPIEKESAKREIIPGDIFDSFPPELPIMDEPDNEGWIQVARSGFAQPVNDEIIVEIKWSTTQIERGLAGSYDWNNSGACIPIIAYRILPNQTPEEENIPTLIEHMDIVYGYNNVLLSKEAFEKREVYRNVSEYLHKYMARKE